MNERARFCELNNYEIILGLNVPQYIKLMPAVESPVGVPVKEGSIQIGNAYRDPTSFRYSAFPRPTIHPCPPVHFCRSTNMN